MIADDTDAVRVARLPDVYCQLSATSKAAPFGVGLLLGGAAITVGDGFFALQALAVAIFITLTAPVAAHALGRAAHEAGVKPCRQTTLDELPPADAAPPASTGPELGRWRELLPLGGPSPPPPPPAPDWRASRGSPPERGIEYRELS